MLSYRHAFHAGNFADVLKHLVLTNTLVYATGKKTPLFYVDTHAGAAVYRLDTDMARKTGEAQAGILALDPLNPQSAADLEAFPDLAAYCQVVRLFLAENQYPGSPALAAALLRKQDRLHLFELHSADFLFLQEHFHADRRVRCEQRDGYSGVLSLLPPAQKRAVVLIDPAYEVNGEYKQAVDCLTAAWRRMPGGQFLLWYPVVTRHSVERMIAALKRSGVRDLWQFEFGMAPDRPGLGMTASGVFAVNPPWILPEQLRRSLRFLQQRLAPGFGHWQVNCLVPE